MGTIVTNLAPLPSDVTLIFHHIPKTAGSTLNAVLDANYAPATIHAIESPIVNALAAVRAMPVERRRVWRVVRGHGVWGLHAWLEQPCVYATLLRDPIDRILSQYYFIRESATHPLHGAMMERGRTLIDYLRNGVNLQADNGQVRALAISVDAAGVEPPYGACSRAMLADALRNVTERYALVGVTERFDEFLVLANRVLGWRKIVYTRQKVTRARPAKAVLSSAERDALDACTALDAVLYTAAVARADAARAQQSWHFGAELAWFRLRQRGQIRAPHKNEVAPLMKERS